MIRNIIGLAVTFLAEPWTRVPRQSTAPPGAGRTGFTLLEMLVALAVIGVLVALVLAALVGSRAQARVTRRLTTHRSVAVALTAYAQDYQDTFLYFLSPGQPQTPPVFEGIPLSSSYFSLGRKAWANFLPPAYLPIPRRDLEGDSEGAIAQNVTEGLPPHYLRPQIGLAHGFYAEPEFFSGPPAADPSFCGAVRLSQLATPAQKGFTFDTSFFRSVGGSLPNDPALIAFGDCSTGRMTSAEVEAAALLLQQRPYGAVPFPVLSTAGGLRGRDR